MPSDINHKNGRRRPTRFHFVLLFLWGSISCIAQPARHDFEVRRISLRDGLVNQSVTAICAGKKGRLWIGTQNGLYVYDGFRINRYDIAGSYLQNLPDHHVTDLEMLEPSGILLVCTRNGACAVDPILQENIPEWSLGIRDGMLGKCTQIEKSRGGYYLAYSPGMIYRIDVDRAGRMQMKPWFKVELYRDAKIAADPTRADGIWLLPRQSQILYLTPDQSRTFSLPFARNNVPEVKGLVHVFYQGQTAMGWDMAWNFFYFDPKRQQWSLSDQTLSDYFPALGQIENVQSHRVMLNGALPLEVGQQGLCTNSGLFIVREKARAFKTIPALQNKEMRGIYIDSSGNWWASTYNGMFNGALRHDRIRTFPSLKGVCSFLPVGPDSCLLAFEMENGIGKWDFKSGTIQKTDIRSPEAGTDHVLSLCRDFRGIVWAGTNRQLLHNDPGSAPVFKGFTDPVSGRNFEQPNIRAILADRDSGIWLGTENGLFHLKFDVSKNRYEMDPESPYASGMVVNSLYQDRFGNLWIATKGNGIACRYRKGHLRWLTTANGLSHDVTCRVEGSNQDRVLWISTHHGLSRFDISTSTFSNYYEENGLPSDEFNAGSSARFPDGNLCFGGLNGLVYFHPDSVAPAHINYRPIISSVNVYNSAEDTLQTFYPGEAGLSLWPYPEYIEILLGSNEFIQRHKIKFRYRMSGISDNWIYTNGESEVNYFKLPPGEYVFEVQTWLPGGHFGERAVLSLSVQPPFYETLWFMALLILAIFFLAHQIYLYRIRRVLKEQVIRQQIADDLHDDIGNKLNIISILAQKIPRLQAPSGTAPQNDALQKLVAVTRDALVSLHTMIWTVDPTKDKVSDLLTRMQDFAEDYLHPLSIVSVFRLPQIIPEREINLKVRHHLILIYQELLTNMIKYSTPHHLTFQITLSESGRLEIEILNEHRQNKIEYETVSANRGHESLRRRLNQVGGSLYQIEMAENLQKTTLTIFNIYKG